MEKRRNRAMVERRKFQGVLNILSFNRHFYVLGALMLCAVLVLFYVNLISLTALICAYAMIAYGLLAPLVVSAYVYDFSGYYNMEWMNDLKNTGQINRILNIHSGFDETSFILQKKYPKSELKALDFYNPERHTEEAIKRARKVTDNFPNTFSIETTHIPEENESADLICLLSAAHEIRNVEERIQFLKECRRVCNPNGRIAVVEHLRDIPNLLAFTVGVTHFHSHTTWKHCFSEAGFSSIAYTNFTPFMRVYNLKP